MIWRSAKSRKKCHKEMVIDTSAQTKFSREFGANKNVIFQFSDNEENYLWILKSKQWKVLYGLINDLKYVLQTNKWTNIIKDDKKTMLFLQRSVHFQPEPVQTSSQVSLLHLSQFCLKNVHKYRTLSSDKMVWLGFREFSCYDYVKIGFSTLNIDWGNLTSALCVFDHKWRCLWIYMLF